MIDKLKTYITDPTYSKIVIIILGFCLIWILIKVIQKRIFSKIKENGNHYKANKFSNFIGYFLTILLITIVYSEKLGGLTVAFGVAGAGVAFALQEVIVSLAGWMAIMFGNFYKTGDRVQLGGIRGDVMDIGVLRTTIMETGQWVDGDLYNGRIVFVANSFIFKEPVFNYSGEFPFLWDEIKIPIQFGSDYDKAESIIKDSGNEIVGDLSKLSKLKWEALQSKFRLEDARSEPMVTMIVNDNWVEFTLRYVVDYKKRRITKTALFKKILKEVESSNGTINFASATYQIVGMPEMNVNVKK